jgi:hypothetical protein
LGERNSRETRRYSATPSSFVSTRADNRLYGAATGDWNEEEKRLFPGLTPLVLAGAALAPPFSPVVLVYGAATLFNADAAMGMNGFIFTELRRYVAPFRGLRAPARFGVLFLLCLAVLAAFGVARLAQRWPRYGIAITCATFALLILEYSAKPVPLMSMPTKPARIYRWLAAAQPPGTIVLEMPVADAQALPFEDPIYMYASTWHWQRLVNGYSGHYYPPYLELLDSLREFPGEKAIEHMTKVGVQIVILHKISIPEHKYERLIKEIEGNPNFHLLHVADDWVAEARAYAFLPGYGPKER